jgi:integrase
MIGQDLIRKLPAGDLDIHDTRLPGFTVRCRQSGEHSYRVQLGRGLVLTLGKVATLQPAEAREAARAAYAEVSRLTMAEMARGAEPAEARRAAAKAFLEGKQKRAEAPTWRAFIANEYAPWAEENRKTGAGTVARLKACFAEFDDLPLTELSAFAVERWRTARLKAGAAPATVNRDLAALRSALTKAREWNRLATNPLAAVKASKVDASAHVRFLTDEEETRLRAALQARDDRRRDAREAANVWRRERAYPEWPAHGRYSDHLTPIVLLALNTGCRRGELLSLIWGDVDLLAGRMTVRAASSKSGRSRWVPLNAEAVDVLRAWRPTLAEASLYVFPGADGERLAGIKTAFSKLLKDARIVGFRFHDTRHHFASRLVQNGVDLNRVRELLGHADLKMTLKYGHLRDTDLAAAVAGLVRP